jgi:outer membrane lipoprotein SlyB
MKKVLLSQVIVLVAILSIVGCARNISSGAYDSKTLGAASHTYECVVVSMRRVAVEEGERLEDNKTGGIMGAIAGGALGNAIGGGRGQVITTAGGALAGAAAGAYAEKALKSQVGIEYVVRLNSGELRSVVQGTDMVLGVGQPAYLIVDPNGRSRVAAR